MLDPTLDRAKVDLDNGLSGRVQVGHTNRLT